MTTEVDNSHSLLIIGFTIDTGSCYLKKIYQFFPVPEGGVDKVGERNIKFNGGWMDTENLLLPKLWITIRTGEDLMNNAMTAPN